jgi:hypothetical protein
VLISIIFFPSSARVTATAQAVEVFPTPPFPVMKKMIIFDPAMCCSTGVCGPSVDKELLRVATLLNNLKSHGVVVERHNLTGNPQIFVDNKTVNRMLLKEGVEVLPIVMIDGEVVKTKLILLTKNSAVC